MLCVANPSQSASSGGSGKPEPGNGDLSPAFVTAGPAAYEVKFVVEDAKAAEIEAWASAHLERDPHGDAALAGSYEVTTLYLDTPRFDAFHNAIELNGAKLRLRRYGGGGQVYLERKRRRGDQVQKRRTPVAETQLKQLQAARAGAEWPGEWFQNEVLAREFRPVCSLSYLRSAYWGQSENGRVRLTLDRRIRCSAVSDLAVGRALDAGACPLADGSVVCELKFQEAMPQAFKLLVAAAGIEPGRFSKYRQACLSLGLVAGREVNDA